MAKRTAEVRKVLTRIYDKKAAGEKLSKRQRAVLRNVKGGVLNERGAKMALRVGK